MTRMTVYSMRCSRWSTDDKGRKTLVCATGISPGEAVPGDLCPKCHHPLTVAGKMVVDTLTTDDTGEKL